MVMTMIKSSLLAQAALAGSLSWLVNLVIILIVVGAVLYIAQTVLALPPQIMQIVWIVVIVATLGNTTGSLIAYAIGAYGGRPFLDRYGRYLLIREHELEVGERFFRRWGAPTVFIGRLLPIVRTFISFPAGVVRMPLRTFIVYSTAGAFIWSAILTYAGVLLGENWQQIRHALQPFDTLILVVCVAAAVLFVWFRLGRPGWPRRTGDITPGE